MRYAYDSRVLARVGIDVLIVIRDFISVRRVVPRNRSGVVVPSPQAISALKSPATLLGSSSVNAATAPVNCSPTTATCRAVKPWRKASIEPVACWTDTERPGTVVQRPALFVTVTEKTYSPTVSNVAIVVPAA